MSLRPLVQWKVAIALRNEPACLTSFFESSQNSGLFGELSVPPRFAFAPDILTPKLKYHQLMVAELSRLGYEPSEPHLPYSLKCPKFGMLTVNLKIRYFRPRVVSLTVTVAGLSELDSYDPMRVREIKGLDQIPPIKQLIGFTLQTFESPRPELALNKRSFPSRCCVLLIDDTALTVLDPPREAEDRSKKVAILIGTEASYRHMEVELVARVFGKNVDQNLKDPRQTLLLDKQGVLLVVPSDSDQREVERRFQKSTDLFELSLVMQVFLNMRLGSSPSDPDAEGLLRYIAPWIKEPDVIFAKSVSNRMAWSLLVKEFGLAPTLRFVTSGSTA